MPLKASGSGCGGFLLGWCIFFGILTFLAGVGRWGLLGTVLPGFWGNRADYSLERWISCLACELTALLGCCSQQSFWPWCRRI